MELAELWQGLGRPLLRLCFFISAGLIVGNLIESLNWTRGVARLASPLVRIGRLKDISGASFSMAFFSGVAANTMLAEAHEKGRLSDRELLVSNLFNSLPTYFLHLPTVFFIALPFLGNYAFVYIGLTLSSAFVRTAAVILGGRLFLPPLPEGCVVCELKDAGPKSWREALARTWRRFTMRIPKILTITVPIYVAVFFANRFGLFEALERFMGDHVTVLSWLHPKALSIVVLSIAAEFTAGLAAAGSLLDSGALDPRHVVMALIVGNILSSPMRAFRHQFPYYAGIFNPRLAVKLMAASQTLRVASLMVVGALYWWLA